MWNDDIIEIIFKINKEALEQDISFEDNLTIITDEIQGELTILDNRTDFLRNQIQTIRAEINDSVASEQISSLIDLEPSINTIRLEQMYNNLNAEHTSVSSDADNAREALNFLNTVREDILFINNTLSPLTELNGDVFSILILLYVFKKLFNKEEGDTITKKIGKQISKITKKDEIKNNSIFQKLLNKLLESVKNSSMQYATTGSLVGLLFFIFKRYLNIDLHDAKDWTKDKFDELINAVKNKLTDLLISPNNKKERDELISQIKKEKARLREREKELRNLRKEDQQKILYGKRSQKEEYKHNVYRSTNQVKWRYKGWFDLFKKLFKK
jgi:hypothetical protein